MHKGLFNCHTFNTTFECTEAKATNVRVYLDLETNKPFIVFLASTKTYHVKRFLYASLRKSISIFNASQHSLSQVEKNICCTFGPNHKRWGKVFFFSTDKTERKHIRKRTLYRDTGEFVQVNPFLQFHKELLSPCYGRHDAEEMERKIKAKYQHKVLTIWH